ncbi:MAG: prephenate dehydratase [Candidatus Goldiibacteriota bacterium]
MPGKKTKGMDYYRKKIDEIDAEIVGLLHKRSVYVKKIADHKIKTSGEIYDPAREAKVLKKLKNLKKGMFPSSGIEAVYTEIFSVSRKMQGKISAAYLGPVASYTHLAAKKRFGEHTEYDPAASIKDVFWKVEKGTVDYGVVPIENSTEGAVNYTYDMFADFDLKIHSEVMMKIHHCLLSREKNRKTIKTVYSHPQSFAQCRGWLERYLPGAALKEVSSNSKGAELAAKTKGAAAIASEMAAAVYGLYMISNAIEDMTDNYTRFFVIARGMSRKTGKDKTTIMVSIKDKPGALYHILRPFDRHKINLTNIESRPSKKKAWDYFFFVDLEGHKDDKKVKEALLQIEKEAGSVKIIGSYPRF